MPWWSSRSIIRMPLYFSVASEQLCSLPAISSSPVGRASQGSRISAEWISGVEPRTGTTRCMATCAPCCWSGFVIPLFNALRDPRLRSDTQSGPTVTVHIPVTGFWPTMGGRQQACAHTIPQSSSSILVARLTVIGRPAVMAWQLWCSAAKHEVASMIPSPRVETSAYVEELHVVEINFVPLFCGISHSLVVAFSC